MGLGESGPGPPVTKICEKMGGNPKSHDRFGTLPFSNRFFIPGAFLFFILNGD